MQTFNRIERVYAGFWARAAAFVIDCVIVWFLRLGVRFALFLSFGLFSDKNPLDATLLFQYSWKDGLLYAAGALYFVLCTYYAGATLGKKALNLRVVSADSKPLTFIDVLFRETIGRFLSSFVLGFGYLLAGITVEKKALHDMLCDTRVIYAKKIPTYINGDINKRYVYCEPSYERKETEGGISAQKEAEKKDSEQNISEQKEYGASDELYKRYVYCEPSYERKETEGGISAQKEAEKKDSEQNISEQKEYGASDELYGESLTVDGDRTEWAQNGAAGQVPETEKAILPKEDRLYENEMRESGSEEQYEALKENCGSNVRNRNSQTQVFRMPPVREVSTRDRKISIYDRYVHVDPDREDEKEN